MRLRTQETVDLYLGRPVDGKNALHPFGMHTEVNTEARQDLLGLLQQRENHSIAEVSYGTVA
jgi:hypothetical protein